MLLTPKMYDKIIRETDKVNTKFGKMSAGHSA
jgi:hypothetical protein